MTSNISPAVASKPDYGIDAPGIRRGMFIAGLTGLGTAAVVHVLIPSPRIGIWISAIALFIAAYGLFMGSYMTYGSRVGKLRARENLLYLCGELRPWRGDEAVLDVGCGRGLMLIGAARRLTTGHAVGIDLWREDDQAGNSPAAASANARCEGVANLIRIDTGDARQLPYPDASFDAVLSHWVVHNLANASDREQALNEMLRVLKPGGVLMLADIANVAQYRDHLESKNVTQLRFLTGGVEAAVMGVLSGGSYRPQALLAIRP